MIDLTPEDETSMVVDPPVPPTSEVSSSQVIGEVHQQEPVEVIDLTLEDETSMVVDSPVPPTSEVSSSIVLEYTHLVSISKKYNNMKAFQISGHL